jgi:DNA-binding CsgD family transcriptional regulator
MAIVVETHGMTGESEQYAFRIAITLKRWDAIAKSLKFSGRELEIVKQLFHGASESDAGRKLGISTHTIHTHLGRLYRKLNVHGCRELILCVFEAYVAFEGAPSTSAEARHVSRKSAADDRPTIQCHRAAAAQCR